MFLPVIDFFSFLPEKQEPPKPHPKVMIAQPEPEGRPVPKGFMWVGEIMERFQDDETSS